MPYSTQDVLQLLRDDIRIAENAVQSKVKVELSQYQFDALVSFAFNVGAGAFSGSTLLRLLNLGDYNGAAEEFGKWNNETINGVLKPNRGLTRRRSDERHLFESNKY